MDAIVTFLQSGLLPTVLLVLRIIAPVMALYVVWRSYTSFKKGQRRRDPVIMLWDEASGTRFPVLYWENSIGRSKSCDIYLPDATASRDHAVLMRRDEGWLICDTGSKSGVLVNGKQIDDRRKVEIGDKITLGSTTLSLWNADTEPMKRRRLFTGFSREAASPFKLMFTATLVHLLMAVQAVFKGGEFDLAPLVPFGLVLAMGWGLYIFSLGVLKRVSFEIETVAYLLSGIGILLLAAEGAEGLTTQLAAMFIGMVLFSFLIWFMNDLERVEKFRLIIAIAAIGLFVINLIFGKNVNGSRNWIFLGPVSIQPSELIKIAFIFVGASTLDRLQTKKNITEFIVFAAACLGFLFLIQDFGTALIFFACFLIIAFMRSGSIRTIVLILAAALLGVFLILQFKPYVVDRFSGWLHVWEHINDNLGYQQTRVLTYIASGGFFGVGLGNGFLKYIFASDSDLVFGMLCEEQGLLLAGVVLAALVLFIFYARSDVTRSRSTFFSITSCAAAGMLLFQACLNVFGATDVLPLTGVTLPFISAGGSSMMSVWGLMAFLKASDERTYAARRVSRRAYEEREEVPSAAGGRPTGGRRVSGRGYEEEDRPQTKTPRAPKKPVSSGRAASTGRAASPGRASSAGRAPAGKHSAPAGKSSGVSRGSGSRYAKKPGTRSKPPENKEMEDIYS